MADLIVEVVHIDEIRPHPDPETTRLELAVVKGWQTVIPKGKYSAGDVAIYVPPDTIVPEETAELWGVAPYLGTGGRVKSVRLRGEMSYGFLADSDGAEVGKNVAADYGLTKWEPPARFTDRDLEPEHPAFHRYTDIERYENFPGLLVEGEEVVITEKIHGTNSRVGLIRHPNEAHEPFFLCGTHQSQIIQGRETLYERPLLMDEVKNLLQMAYNDFEARSVILFGEIYGWVQSLRYGHDKNGSSYRAFDLSIDGKYLDWNDVCRYCEENGVQTVPELYCGPFSAAKLLELSGGQTTLGANHVREGVVVHPVAERRSSVGTRMILKRISDEYELKRDKISDSH